jgi:hypothetical protein
VKRPAPVKRPARLAVGASVLVALAAALGTVPIHDTASRQVTTTAATARPGVILAAGTALSGVTSAAAGARPTRTSLTAMSCPAATHPGDGSTQPYRLALRGTLAGTLSITKSPAGAITLPQIAGTFCGLLELPLEEASVTPSDLSINPVTVRIARANVPARIGGAGVTVGSVATSPAPNGGLNLTLAAPVEVTTGLLGVSCLLPVDVSLATTAPGGSPLVGPLTDAHATVAQSGFAIQPAISTGTGGTCPSYLADQVDHLLDLPNASTSSTVSVTLDITIP